MSDLVGAAISAGGTLIGSVLNTGLQREQYNYQKHLNNQVMAREDTAYQRKIADLRRAGLNPAMALGGSGSGAQALRAGSLDSNIQTGAHEAVQSYQQLRAQRNHNDMTDAQLHILASQAKEAAARARISQHDAGVITSRPGQLSTERPTGSFGIPTPWGNITMPGWVPERLGRWLTETDPQGQPLYRPNAGAPGHSRRHLNR